MHNVRLAEQQRHLMLSILDQPNAPWGDYGDILIHGLCEADDHGTLIIRRTGPFLPPISQPHPAVVVSDQFKQQVTIRLDKATVDYFKNLAEKHGIPDPTLINLHLRDYATSGRRLSMKRKSSA